MPGLLWGVLIWAGLAMLILGFCTLYNDKTCEEKPRLRNLKRFFACIGILIPIGCVSAIQIEGLPKNRYKALFPHASMINPENLEGKKSFGPDSGQEELYFMIDASKVSLLIKPYRDISQNEKLVGDIIKNIDNRNWLYSPKSLYWNPKTELTAEGWRAFDFEDGLWLSTHADNDFSALLVNFETGECYYYMTYID